ncbi:MAG: TylF/MycF/NovP-related O-methyltransferase [Bacteroidota bacterium]
MKQKINEILEKISGYRLVRFHNNFYSQKYAELIQQTVAMYKEVYQIDVGDFNAERLFLISQLYGTSIPEAIYLLNYLGNSLRLDGDICEFGVAQGSTSALLAHEIRRTTKNLWLFDSFEGLPAPTAKDVLEQPVNGFKSMKEFKGTMAYSVGFVKRKLQQIQIPLERIKIVPGFVNETIKLPHLPEKVCFAYIDFDFYEPLIIALNFLNSRIAKGGCMMVDDYGSYFTGAKAAVDEFFDANKDKYEQILPNQSAGYFCMLVRK